MKATKDRATTRKSRHDSERDQLTLSSPIGLLTIVSDGNAVVAICCQKPGTQGRGKGPDGHGVARRSSVLDAARRQLDEYFKGRRTQFDLPLAPEGTEFERTVWRALSELPFGTTCSYGDIARRIGKPSAFRAVGNANRKNPIPIVVPCHRVVGTDGRLTGFALGLETKRWLLAHEGITTEPAG